MASPYEAMSDDELEAEIRRLEAQSSQPTVIPLPQTPGQRRDEVRDNARLDIARQGSARSDAQLDLSRQGESRAGRKEAFDYASSLRKEFNASQSVKDYQIVVRQFASALEAQPNPTGDQALITAYAKMLDPGSVVREQEFNVVAAGDSRLGQSVARLKREFGLDRSGLLRPEVRERVKREMLNLTSRYNDSYNQARKQYADLASRNGIDSVEVIGAHYGEPFYDQIDQAFPAKNAMQQDTVTPQRQQLASGDDETQSIPIPQAMQDRHVRYLQENKGRLDPEAYAQFRLSEDREFGFPAAGPEKIQGYRDFANEANRAWSQGGNVNLTIPPVDAAMTGQDKLNASLFNNEVGAAVFGAPIFAGGMDEVAGLARSVLNGTDYSVERDVANAMRQQLSDQYPKSTIAGALAGGLGAGAATARLAPRIAETLGRNVPRMIGFGGGAGAVQGGLESNNDRAAGAGLGLVAGAGGAALGAGLTPAGRRAMRIGPRLSQTDRAVSTAPASTIRANVQDAANFGLPYALADATPQTRALAGSAARFAPRIREMADTALTARKDETPERAMNAIRQQLAPPVDVAARQGELRRAGSTASSPDYEKTFNRAAPVSDEVASIVNTREGQQALEKAYQIAENEGYDPKAIGFDLDDQGEVILRNNPSFRTLDLVKRGLDDIVEKQRNPVTGNLDLTGQPGLRATDTLRKRLIAEMDRIEPGYAKARGAYQEYASQAEDLGRGYAAPPRNVLPRTVQQVTEGMKEPNLAEYRTGYATRLSDDVAKMDQGNPYKTIYGSPGSTTSQKKIKVDTLFPGNRMGRISELERDMENTYREVLGGSQTQPRRVADEQFANDGIARNALIDVATGAPGVATGMGAVRGLLRDASDRGKLGLLGPQKRAEEIGSVLLDTGNQRRILDYLDELSARQSAAQEADRKARLYGSLTGGLLGASFTPAIQ